MQIIYIHIEDRSQMLAGVSFLSNVREVKVRNVHLTQGMLLTEIEKNQMRRMFLKLISNVKTR